MRRSARTRSLHLGRLLQAGALAIAAPAVAGGWGGAAHGQGVAYEVAPMGTYLTWDEALGLRDDYLLGGRVGLRFGGVVELQGYYLTRSDVEADASRLPVVPGFSPPSGLRPVDVQSYGGDLRLNLLSGALVPFVSGGGGVLRLSPADGDATEQILLKAGGGLRVGWARGLGAQLTAESWALRMNRFNLFAPAGAFEDPEADRTRYNLVLSAALTVPLGGDVAGPASGVQGTSLHVEPLIGRLEFADALELERQNLLGARAGLELHRLVGLRGFYWRGLDRDFTATEPIQGYGGEVQFNLASGFGLVPHLTAGAGRIDFRDGYADPEGMRPEDRTTLILGGGLSFALGERLRATIGVRDYILAEDGTRDLRRTDQLSHNLLLTGGLGFAVGGRAPTLPPAARPLSELERLRLENERLRRLEQTRRAVTDTVVVDVDPVTGELVERVVALEPAAVRPERTMLVSIPEEGEIYIRYGPGSGVRTPPLSAAPTAPGVDPIAAAAEPAAISPAELRSLIQEAVREEVRLEAGALLGPGPGPAATQTEQQRLALLEQRLVERIEATLTRRLGEQERRLGRLEAAPERTTTVVPRAPAPAAPIVVIPPPTLPPLPPRAPEPPAAEPAEPAAVPPPPPPLGLGPRHGRPYTGAGLTGARQWVFGGRIDLGRIREDLPLSLVPDAAASVGGGGSSFMLGLNLQYDVLPPELETLVAPYVHGGVGLWQTTRTSLTFNAGYGVSVRVLTSPTRPLRVFVEHQGISVFRRNRFLIGTQLGL